MTQGSKRIFITGATGFVGSSLANSLANQGQIIHALIRDENKARKYINHSNIHYFNGDLMNTDSLHKAASGCEESYHLAGYVNLWHRDKNTFYRYNVTGTENVLKACLEEGVKKFVFTSTAGVIGPSDNGLVTEDTIKTLPSTTEYERTKEQAEALVRSYANQGLQVVIVNPTRVFGPGPMSKSNAVTMLIDKYSKGKWKLLPGDGNAISNYVYIDDVVLGHQLAMEKGISGERYIIAGDNVSYIDFFNTIGKITGKTYKLTKVPVSLILFMAHFQQIKADLFGIAPLITPGFARKYLYNWKTGCYKANKYLGYNHKSLEYGIQQTLKWLNFDSNTK